MAPVADRGPDAAIFRRRAEFSMRQPPTPFRRRAVEALADGGTVLDVGVGAGAGSLPLAPAARLIVGVDRSESMLREFRSCAEAFGISVCTVLGLWPQVAHTVDAVDVVICHHVLYQVGDLPAFVEALASHARRRVLIEMTTRHPQAWMADLWLRFHGLERPTRPTSDDAEAALRELGLPVEREDHLLEMPPTGFAHREDAVTEVCERLCVPLERAPEVEAALGDRLTLREGLWSSFPPFEEVSTLWWDVEGATR
ncbi:MAG TPA: class I SAM-dependent methyltransferase [Actinomycetota bacterium]